MSELVLLALLVGLGVAAASSSSEEQPGSDVSAAQQPSFFQLPDVFSVATTPAPAQPQFQEPAFDAPYWFAEVQRRFPGLPIKVGPSE